MAHFVANHHADSPVVDGLVRIRIKERRLQDSGRETNLVGGRVVVGIDSLRRHSPLRLVGRFAQLRQVVSHIPGTGGAQVVVVGQFRVHIQRGVVFPLVGISNLDDEVGKFLLRLHLGRIAHPVEGGDVLAPGLLQVLDQLEHPILGTLREILLDIHTADRFAQNAVGNGHRPFPARFGLLDTGHLAGIELETGIVEVIADRTAGSADQMGGQVIFEHLQIGLAEIFGESLEIGRLADNEEGLGRNAADGKISRKIKAREGLGQLLGGVRVVLGGDVALLLPAPGNLGHKIFHRQSVRSHFFRSFQTGEGEHLHQEFAVALTDFSILFFQVIIAVADAQAALTEIENLVVAVLQVRLDISPEETAFRFLMEFGQQGGQLRLVRHRIHLRQIGFKRSGAFGIEAGGIQALFIEVDNFTLHAAGLRLHRGHRSKKVVQPGDVGLTQFIERAETGKLRFERVVLLPTAGRILVKILTGCDGRIQVGQIECGNFFPSLSARKGHHQRNHHYKNLFHRIFHYCFQFKRQM